MPGHLAGRITARLTRDAPAARTRRSIAEIAARLGPHAPAAVPGLGVVALMLLWAVHNGGYDAETWYWGALAALALLATIVVALSGRLRVTRGRLIVLGLFAGYVAWCYLSMLWAKSPGSALDGANQALLYLLVFALMALLPWTAEGALVAVLTYTVGIGVIGIVLMFRLASASHIASLIIEGRLGSPTGYFNATAALFTLGALPAIALAARRELPGAVRGLLLAFACSDLQLSLIVQSRGWLFTLPLVAAAGIFVVHERFRVAMAAVLPLGGAGLLLHRLLAVYSSSGTVDRNHAAAAAGQAGLIACAVILVLGTLLAWADSLWPPPTLGRNLRRFVGTTLIAGCLVAIGLAGTLATHGHPVRFISRQWRGFSHVQRSFSGQSHFGDVGSSRYDFWRVSLDGFRANPIGGLGEDNFADYYVVHRRTSEEPSWTHSLELRLLSQTGLVGFALFTAFLTGALWLAVRVRRRGEAIARGVAGIALLPLVVWLIHGSLDWFWEIPALSGPALAFLGMAGSVAPIATPATRSARASRWGARPAWQRLGAIAGGIVALVAGVVVLGFPYLSVREVSLASNVRAANPDGALLDLERAANLNPLNAEPGRLAGFIALQNGQYGVADQRFRQSIDREPGGWLSQLGAGLAASALGQRQQAHRDYARAYAINNRQPAVVQALRRVYTKHPLTSAEAVKLFILAQ
jgi:hypothetical protein